MFIINRLTRFQSNNQVVIYNKIRKILSYNRLVFITNRNGELLHNLKASLSQTMRKRILIHFFQIPISMEDMDRISYLSHLFNHSHTIIDHVILSFFAFSAFSAVNNLNS